MSVLDEQRPMDSIQTAAVNIPKRVPLSPLQPFMSLKDIILSNDASMDAIEVTLEVARHRHDVAVNEGQCLCHVFEVRHNRVDAATGVDSRGLPCDLR